MPARAENEKADAQNDPPPTPVDQETCRICLDGPDPDLGRLIRPCLCKGTISHVHVKCLQRWRMTAPNGTAFFECPQCHYKYNFMRTKALGLASNPIILAIVTAILFTALVMASSFITTLLVSPPEPELPSNRGFTVEYVDTMNPVSFAYDFVRTMVGVLRDQEAAFEQSGSGYSEEYVKPSFMRRFAMRFLLGLPLVSAGSLFQLFSWPFVAPVQILARYRGRRRSRNTKDAATALLVALVLWGAAKTLGTVYRWTGKLAHRILLRAEDAVLEV